MLPATDLAEDRAASTLELFFDLVFVLAITEVATILTESHSVSGTLRGALLLLMFWWTWGLFTWTTNWTGTSSIGVRASLLVAMAVLLLLAGAVPHAYTTSGLWLAVCYLVVRYIAALVYYLGVRASPEQRAALLTFLPTALVAPLVVVAGAFVEGGARPMLWALAMVVDLLAAAMAGRGAWSVAASHFAERHGLFVIIALGETIVAIGAAAASRRPDASLGLALAATFAIAAGLWWSYFDRTAGMAEDRLATLTGRDRGRFARDAYTLFHYPIVLGVVLYAVAAEEVVAHPGEQLTSYARFALAFGVVLVLGSLVVVLYRAAGTVAWPRLAGCVAVTAAVASTSGMAATTTAIAVACVLGVALWLEGTGEAWP